MPKMMNRDSFKVVFKYSVMHLKIVIQLRFRNHPKIKMLLLMQTQILVKKLEH